MKVVQSCQPCCSWKGAGLQKRDPFSIVLARWSSTAGSEPELELGCLQPLLVSYHTVSTERGHARRAVGMLEGQMFPATFWEGVRKLEPGSSWRRVDLGRESIDKWP